MMPKRTSWKSICILLLCTLCIAGCGRREEIDEDAFGVFYLNTDGTGLVRETCELEGGSTREQVQQVMELLQEEPDTIDYKSVFTGEVAVESWDIDASVLELTFSGDYDAMDDASEMLFRAAIVQSVTQLPDIDAVIFYLGIGPLLDANGEEVGPMRGEDFVQNVGSSIHSYQMADITLYYANQSGNQLVAEQQSVRYNSNTSIEKLVVDQLIKGPTTEGANPVIAPETKVLGVSVNEGVCYVNFDEGFLNTVGTMDPRLTIYAIANSIIEASDVTEVQILVNGETNVSYQGTVNLSEPFEENLELVEE